MKALYLLVHLNEKRFSEKQLAVVEIAKEVENTFKYLIPGSDILMKINEKSENNEVLMFFISNFQITHFKVCLYQFSSRSKLPNSYHAFPLYLARLQERDMYRDMALRKKTWRVFILLKSFLRGAKFFKETSLPYFYYAFDPKSIRCRKKYDQFKNFWWFDEIFGEFRPNPAL